MKLAKWEDGYVLDADPRREDPLYYYMQDGDWGSALGLQVDPLYEEHNATTVRIQVFPEHRFRESGMDKIERVRMYARVIPVLLARFPKWSQVTLQSSYLQEVLEDGNLSTVLADAGFSRSGADSSDQTIWTKG